MKSKPLAPSPAALFFLVAFVASAAWEVRPPAGLPGPAGGWGRPDGEPPIRVLRTTPGIGDTLAKRLLDARWSVPVDARSAVARDVAGLGPERLRALAEGRVFAEDDAEDEFADGAATE